MPTMRYFITFACYRRDANGGMLLHITHLSQIQRALDGPWIMRDDLQIGPCRAVRHTSSLLPLLQRAQGDLVPVCEFGLR